MKKTILTVISIMALVPLVSMAASLFQPNQGGTGTACVPSLGQVLVGTSNGNYNCVATSSLNIAGGGSGTNYFTNSGANTFLTTGTNLQAATVNATSTTGASQFNSNVVLPTTATNSGIYFDGTTPTSTTYYRVGAGVANPGVEMISCNSSGGAESATNPTYVQFDVRGGGNCGTGGDLISYMIGDSSGNFDFYGASLNNHVFLNGDGSVDIAGEGGQALNFNTGGGISLVDNSGSGMSFDGNGESTFDLLLTDDEGLADHGFFSDNAGGTGSGGQALESTGSGGVLWQSTVNSIGGLTGAVATSTLNIFPNLSNATGILSVSRIAGGGSTNQVLTTNGLGSAVWSSVNLASSAAVGASILGIANGGTGTSSCPANRVLLSNGTAFNCVATSTLNIAGGGGTNYFTNSGATTTLTTGTELDAGNIYATSTTATSSIMGELGLGTNSPTHALSIVGDEASILSAANGGGILLQPSNFSASLGYTWNDEGGTQQDVLYAVQNNGNVVSDSLSDDFALRTSSGFRLRTGSDGFGASNFTVLGNGFTGIGTTTPSWELSVLGTTTSSEFKAAVDGSPCNANYQFNVSNPCFGIWAANAGGTMNFSTGSGSTFTMNGSNFLVPGNVMVATGTSLYPLAVGSSTSATTGLFSVDRSGNQIGGGAAPSVSCAATCTLDPHSHDSSGTIYISGVQTVVTVTWAAPKPWAPHCVASDSVTAGNYDASSTPTQLVLSTAVSIGTASISWVCQL